MVKVIEMEYYAEGRKSKRKWPIVLNRVNRLEWT